MVLSMVLIIVPGMAFNVVLTMVLSMVAILSY
jgi:hypothetical protein